MSQLSHKYKNNNDHVFKSLTDAQIITDCTEDIFNDTYDLLVLLHLIGLSFGLGAATVKMVFVIKSNADHEFLPVYFKVTKIVTKLIVSGIVILTLSGIGWLIYGSSFSPLFIVKLVLVGLM